MGQNFVGQNVAGAKSLGQVVMGQKVLGQEVGHQIFRAFGRSERSPFADHGDIFLFEIGQTLTGDLGV